MTTPTPLPPDAAALDRLAVRVNNGYRLTAVECRTLIAQSRAALTLAARVAELERENAAMFHKLAIGLNESLKWEAHANALRDALERVMADRNNASAYHAPDDAENGRHPADSGCYLCAALAATPAASLAAYRKSVLEEAAKEAEYASHESGAQGYSGGPKYVDMTKLAAKIRALAAQAQEVK